MKSLAEHAARLHELVKDMHEEMAQIQADGVLEYEEVVEGRKSYIAYQNALKSLKKEVSLDIRDIRNRYKGEILKAKSALSGKEQTERVGELQLEQHKMTAPYEQVVQTIDRLLLTAANDKGRLERFSEDMKRLDVDALPVGGLPASSTPAASTQSQAVEEADTVIADELSALVNKWAYLLQDVTQKLADPDQDPLHVAQLKGAKRVLELAIADVSQLVGDGASSL